ncbi:hypothetical protein HHL24_26715 [Paraburkholderia sp. RP-4-7]|jgi:membrane protein implicated in regulation of membrane protease activity|uniref:Uncharacterized protein n=1 Tax=Paraburkholderia polaris TaxID=2728848 RepID=A0A848IQT7_9BURK|nr:hypothetical protein [Paraburkholderia polaris]NMM01517.1 hypothetical protein [Paraburkholderia polaris]
MQTVAIFALALCTLSIAQTLRTARRHLLAMVHALGCAGVIAGELVPWPFDLRIAIWIAFVGSAICGGSKMRKREFDRRSNR